VRTEKEEKKEKLKPNMNVGDVLKNGYGSTWDINYFFAALARAAGFDTAIIVVTARDEDYFMPQLYSTRQLNASMVHVKLGDEQWFLDPASRYAPFGCLRWQETASRGIRPEKDGYTAIGTPTQEYRRGDRPEGGSSSGYGRLLEDARSYTRAWRLSVAADKLREDEVGYRRR
jgi:hypothetical protein